MSIIKLLSKKLNRILFTTPSHNQKPIFDKELSEFYKKDFSEIEGFDNLSKPKNAIFFAQGKVADILNTRRTFFVTQGATTAILSAMKAIIKPKDKVLVARNCHKSVFSGLILTQGIVDWFIPDFDEDWGMYTQIDPDKLSSTLELNQYKVFIMTSPTYMGVNSDIEKIAEVCKKHGTYLIVDEAWGSLNGFNSNLKQSAIAQGADISVNSLHKTAGALNQCAILNVSRNLQNIEMDVFQNALNLFHTTSPSYPLLRNIEYTYQFLNSKKGKKEINSLISNIEAFKKELLKYDIEFYENENQDPTKILLRKKGLNGKRLSEILFNQFKIEEEMSNSTYCLFICGIGTQKNKLDKLKNALKKIKGEGYEFEKHTPQPYPMVKIQPYNTFNCEFNFIHKDNCLHRISNKIIMPYPPGIGLLYPGEAIQNWHKDYLKNDIEVIK